MLQPDDDVTRVIRFVLEHGVAREQMRMTRYVDVLAELGGNHARAQEALCALERAGEILWRSNGVIIVRAVDEQ